MKNGVQQAKNTPAHREQYFIFIILTLLFERASVKSKSRNRLEKSNKTFHLKSQVSDSTQADNQVKLSQVKLSYPAREFELSIIYSFHRDVRTFSLY